MALSDKVEELQRTVATLQERVTHILNSLDKLHTDHKETVHELAELRREHEKDLLLLKRDGEDIKKWREEKKKEGEERTRRFWAFGPNVVGALVSGVISAVVAYLVARG
jgi:predicted  nucleic acid-binding Zn-ribbon protein